MDQRKRKSQIIIIVHFLCQNEIIKKMQKPYQLIKKVPHSQVSNALNSAILDSVKGKPGRPPLEIALIHSKQLVKLMANNDLGACAFANVEDFVN